MKSIFTTMAFSLLMAICMGTTAYAVNPVNDTHQPELSELTVDQIVNMTARDFEEISGTNLTLKDKVVFKMAQKRLKRAQRKGSDEPDKILIYVLCWFLPPLAVALLYDIGKEFWVNVILTVLCVLPGIIHAFVLASRYYK